MDFFYANLAVLSAAMLSTSIGFGFALLSLPFLIMIYPAKLAIIVNIALALLTNLINLPRVWNYLDKEFIVKMTTGALFGIPVGVLLYTTLDIRWLKIIISFIILVLTLLLIKGLALPLPRQKAPHVIGVFSGLLGAAVSLPGPPIILYLASRNTSKEYSSGITVSLFCFVYSISLIVYIFSGNLPRNFWSTTFPLIPAVIAGIILGSFIQNHINHQLFRRITFSLLLSSALYTIWTNFCTDTGKLPI